MKKRIYQSLLLAVMFLPMYYYTAQATGPDTLWTREFGYGILGAPEEGLEFHPTNDSIFIYTGRTYINDVLDDTYAVHFVNTVTGQEYLSYGPIHEAHYNPDGNFIIGHNDSTIAYISLDSMKPVRTYPVLNARIVHYTIDEKGKYIYTTMYFPDSSKTPFAFFRWDIANGTVQRVDLPDSLLDIGWPGCPINNIVIEDMLVSDTTKILLMQIFVDRPKPHCPAETRVWGIDLNADTLKYDFTKLHPTYTMSILEKIMPKRTQFIGCGWKYENNIDSSYFYVFDVATGAKVKEMQIGGFKDYTFSKDETFLIGSCPGIAPYRRIIVFDNSTSETVYEYNDDIPKGDWISLSPNYEYILLDGVSEFLLYSTPWFPTLIIKPKDETPETLIYPNPATDYIEISGSSVILNEVKDPFFRIYDVLGIEITTPSLRDTPPNQGGEIVRVDVSQLAAGVYFLRVGDVVRKFVKM